MKSTIPLLMAILGFWLLFSVQQAQAGVYLEVTGLPVYLSDNTQETKYAGGSVTGTTLNTSSGFSYDLRSTVGYVLWDHLLLGFSYNYANNPSKAAATNTSPSLDSYTRFREKGLALGYVHNRFRIIGSYLWGGVMNYSDRQIMSDGTPLVDYSFQNNGGVGYQIIMGYNIPLNEFMSIGPTLVYRKITYQSQSKADSVGGSGYADTPFTTKASFSNLTPMVSIMFEIGK